MTHAAQVSPSYSKNRSFVLSRAPLMGMMLPIPSYNNGFLALTISRETQPDSFCAGNQAERKGERNDKTEKEKKRKEGENHHVKIDGFGI